MRFFSRLLSHYFFVVDCIYITFPGNNKIFLCPLFNCSSEVCRAIHNTYTRSRMGQVQKSWSKHGQVGRQSTNLRTVESYLNLAILKCVKEKKTNGLHVGVLTSLFFIRFDNSNEYIYAFLV